jgi:hypothetical protein
VLASGKGVCGWGEAEPRRAAPGFHLRRKSSGASPTSTRSRPNCHGSTAAAGRKIEYTEYPCELQSSAVVELAEHP